MTAMATDLGIAALLVLIAAGAYVTARLGARRAPARSDRLAARRA
ncbi:hypothetical protein ACFCXS_23840 [Streptomyces sp. NPDC056373]